jgi:hypothetical protein
MAAKNVLFASLAASATSFISDLDPPVARALLQMRSAHIAVLRQALRHPFFDAAFRVQDQTGFGGAADDRLEGGSGFQDYRDPGIHGVAVGTIAENEPVILVVE